QLVHYEIILVLHETIVTDNSVIMVVSHRDYAHRRLLGLSYHDLHSSASNDLAKALAAVDHCSRLGLSDDSALVCEFCPSVLQIRIVSGKPGDPVRIDTP